MPALGLGLGLALALAPALEGCDSVREQFVRLITSADRVRTKRTPGRIEQYGAMDKIDDTRMTARLEGTETEAFRQRFTHGVGRIGKAGARDGYDAQLRP